LLHRPHCRARADARRRRALKLERGKAVVARQLHRRIGPFERRESGEGCHALAVRSAHVEVLNVLRLLTVGLVRLDVHALDATAVDEVVDVGSAPGARDGRVDLADVEAKRPRLVLIDVDAELRSILETDWANAGDALVL